MASTEELVWLLIQQPSPHAPKGKQFPLFLTEAVTEQISAALSFTAARFSLALAPPSLTDSLLVALRVNVSVCKLKE